MCYPCPSTPFFKLEEYKTVFLVISGLIAIVLFLFGWLLQYYTQSSYLARCWLHYVFMLCWGSITFFLSLFGLLPQYYTQSSCLARCWLHCVFMLCWYLCLLQPVSHIFPVSLWLCPKHLLAMFQCPKEGNHDVFILLQVTFVAFGVDLFENNCCILV